MLSQNHKGLSVVVDVELTQVPEGVLIPHK